MPISQIFSPVEFKSFTLPSRLVFAPINTGFTTQSRPSYRLLRFQRERSGPSIGISYLGNVAIEHSKRTNDNTAILEDRTQVPRYAVVARAIKSQGSIPGIQIAGAPVNLSPLRQWRTADVPSELNRLIELVSSLTDSEIEATLRKFHYSCILAKASGFDVIQVHAAHGYLLSLLLHPEINRRNGRYSCEGIWFDDFLANIKSSLNEKLLSIRLSTITSVLPTDREISWTRHLAERSVAAGVDILDYSAGLYTIDRRLIYPGSNYSSPVYSQWISNLSENLNCLIVISGRIIDLRETQYLKNDNILIGIGRALIADPNFANKSKAGEFESIVPCTLKNKCHYFSRGVPSLECGMNQSL